MPRTHNEGLSARCLFCVEIRQSFARREQSWCVGSRVSHLNFDVDHCQGNRQQLVRCPTKRRVYQEIDMCDTILIGRNFLPLQTPSPPSPCAFSRSRTQYGAACGDSSPAASMSSKDAKLTIDIWCKDAKLIINGWCTRAESLVVCTTFGGEKTEVLSSGCTKGWDRRSVQHRRTRDGQN